MSNYIEFTTAYDERTFGNPVHDGKRPRKYHDVGGIRVDGELVEFQDELIPERVQRYLIESRRLWRRRISNDCVAFVALMNSIELTDRNHNPFKNFDTTISIDTSHIDLEDENPLVLVQGFHDGVKIPRHIVLPAHHLSGQSYLHKLGDKGPVCMSDLNNSMRIMGCTSIHPVVMES